MIKKIKPYLITVIIIQFLVSSVHPPLSFAAVPDPNVTILSSTIQGKNVTIHGKFSTTLGDLSSVKMQIKDNTNKTDTISDVRPNTTTGIGEWSYSFPSTAFPSQLSNGNYSFTIVATADLLDSTGTTSSETIVNFTVDATGPTIAVNSPSLQTKNVVISGTVVDNHTPGNEITMELKLFDSNNTLVNSAIFSGTDLNTWSHTFPDIATGQYTYTVSATDGYQNKTGDDLVYNLTVDTTRPKVSSIMVDYVDPDPDSTTGKLEINLLTSEVMNNVKRDTSFTVSITDEHMLTADKINSLILIYSSAGVNVTGETPVVTRVTDTNYKVVFKPTALSASTTYYLYINPAYIDLSPGSPATTDAAGNPLFPLIRKFTTERPIDTTNFSDAQKVYHDLNDPHGKFATNTNTCSNCHSTHASSEPKLGQPSFDYSTYNYCMACHDGTVAARPENMSQNGHFPSYNDTTVKQMATDCSTCHNPHLTWRAENPSLLDDHYVVENHPAVPGTSADMFDSDKILCESCHEGDSGIVKTYIPKDANDPIKVSYKVLHYRQVTATGVNDDYALCFRCHDGSKPDITNIKTYYQDTASKHRITAIDGGQLSKNTTPLADGTIPNDGHIPCSECHGTHGSSNLKILKNKVGHEDRRGFSAPTSVPGDWGATKERDFCSKCHNGSTAIYGVTGEALKTRTGHDPVIDKDKACSSCHGGEGTVEEKALRAAHSPR